MMLLSEAPPRPTRELRPAELAVLREVVRPLTAKTQLRAVEIKFVRGAILATLVSSLIWLLIVYEAVWTS